MTTLTAALEELYARAPRGIRLGVESMQNALDRAGGVPFPIVHVAGTNGKGSVCAMVEAALRENSVHTGMYTSPHLCRFAERIRIDGASLPDAALTGYLRDAMRIGAELSFFEVATLAALLAFRDAKVSMAVLEVGLGGRYDATNVALDKRVTAITSIALDHQQYLGTDTASIAAEKAGILRASVPCVLGALDPIARAVIAREAKLRGAPILEAVTYPGTLSLGGAHQQGNADVAWTITQLLGVAEDAAIRGIANAKWPGRYEWLHDARVLLDGAHNPEGVAALVASLRAEEELVYAGTLDRPPLGALVFGAMADKPAAQMLAPLHPLFPHHVYVAPSGRAPSDPYALAAEFGGSVAADVPSALAEAQRLAQGGAVVVAGSLYLVGAARAHLLGIPSDPPIAL